VLDAEALKLGQQRPRRCQEPNAVIPVQRLHQMQEVPLGARSLQVGDDVDDGGGWRTLHGRDETSSSARAGVPGPARPNLS